MRNISIPCILKYETLLVCVLTHDFETLLVSDLRHDFECALADNDEHENQEKHDVTHMKGASNHI